MIEQLLQQWGGHVEGWARDHAKILAWKSEVQHVRRHDAYARGETTRCETVLELLGPDLISLDRYHSSSAARERESQSPLPRAKFDNELIDCDEGRESVNETLISKEVLGEMPPPLVPR